MHEKPYFVHESSFIDHDVKIGKGTKIWYFCHIQSGARIGHHCVLGQNVNIGHNVSIGNFVKIQNNVSVYEGVTIKDYVFCGPSVVFTNIEIPRSKYPQAGSEFYVKTLVNEGASLGANSTILCGITIGRHALVGAGSMVNKDIPDFALVVGIPARQIGWVSESGQRLNFDGRGLAHCPISKVSYKLEKAIVTEMKPYPKGKTKKRAR